MDNVTIMKLDGIQIAERRPVHPNRLGALKALEQRLRKFFNEADGHGSLMRRPPPTLITPRYFRLNYELTSCYPVNRMNWIGLVSSKNYKSKIPEKEEEANIKAAQQKLANSWENEYKTNKKK